MENVKDLSFFLKNVNFEDEEILRNSFNEKLKEFGYSLIDENAVIREGKLSSMRGIELKTQEEVEMYVYAKSLPNNEISINIKIL